MMEPYIPFTAIIISAVITSLIIYLIGIGVHNSTKELIRHYKKDNDLVQLHIVIGLAICAEIFIILLATFNTHIR